jgi:hypothetical protein
VLSAGASAEVGGELTVATDVGAGAGAGAGATMAVGVVW